MYYKYADIFIYLFMNVKDMSDDTFNLFFFSVSSICGYLPLLLQWWNFVLSSYCALKDYPFSYLKEFLIFVSQWTFIFSLNKFLHSFI